MTKRYVITMQSEVICSNCNQKIPPGEIAVRESHSNLYRFYHYDLSKCGVRRYDKILESIQPAGAENAV